MNNRRCYTPTEFALFGLGAVVLGIMVGVVGISWFKSHCLPDEKEELRERERELAKQQRIMRKFKILFLFTVFSRDIYHAKYYGKGWGTNKITLKKGEKALKMHLFGL